MQIRRWLNDEWKEIKGKVKYDIYKGVVFWLGAFVITSGAYFVHKIWHSEWVPYAAVFILSLFAFIWMSRYASKPSNSPSASPTRFKESVEPKKPNLRAEVMEAFCLMRRHSLSNDNFILLNLRVVNHGEEDAVVTDWGLTVAVGDATMPSREYEIEHNWQIQRMPMGGVAVMEIIDRDASSFLHPLKKGVPKTRWICFQVLPIPLKILPPHSAKFILTLTDAFGNSHISESGPGFALDTGELVEVQSGADNRRATGPS